MEEHIAAQDYRGEERRRRWPGLCLGEERRAEPLAGFETDQEPDQSPLVIPGTTAPPG